MTRPFWLAFYLLPPILAALLAGPLLGLVAAGHFHWVMILILSPFALGALGAVGYGQSALGEMDLRWNRERPPGWMSASVVCIFVASAIGAGGGSLMALFFPFSALSGLAASSLLVSMHRRQMRVRFLGLAIAVAEFGAFVAISCAVAWVLNCGILWGGLHSEIQSKSYGDFCTATMRYSVVGAITCFLALAFLGYLLVSRKKGS